MEEIKMSKALILENMTWQELQKVKDKVELIIIPVGSTEQHGPNTTFSTDTIRAKKIGEMIGDVFGDKVLIAPTLPIGLSYHHMKFPGTITFSLETYLKILRDICWSFKQHGFKKILFLSGHGGNKRPIQEYASEAKKEFDMDIYMSGIGGSLVTDLSNEHGFSKFKGHACEVETSQTMYLAPEHVRYDSLEKAKFKDDTKYLIKKYAHGGSIFWDYREVTENGALGDATKASIEFGKEMNEIVINKITEFIEKIIL
jgi:creatinine amidohydrolase